MTLNACLLAVIQIKDNLPSPFLAQSYHQYQAEKQKEKNNNTMAAYIAYLQKLFHKIDAPRGINKHLRPLLPVHQYPHYEEVTPLLLPTPSPPPPPLLPHYSVL